MVTGGWSASVGVVGVDFGTRAVKMLQLRQRRGLRVVGAGLVELGDDGAPDAATLTEQLRAAFAAGGFTGRRCVVSLPRRDVRIQSVRLPKMPPEELRQAAVWEAAQRFGLEKSAMEVEMIRTGAALQGGENREEVLLVAVSHGTIETWVEPLLAAGLRPVAIETHFTALARAFSRGAGSQEVVVVVDVGAAGATVIILRGDQIAFCKPIEIGGRHFDEAVSEHLQMNLEAARDLRAGRIAAFTGQPQAVPMNDPAIERAEYDAVRPLLGRFAKELMLCIRYYGVTFRGGPPERLILTGGDGLEPRLGETLAHHCKIPVVLDNQASPVRGHMSAIRAALHRAAGPPAWWSVAAGLSLRGISSAMLRKAGTVRREAA